MWKFDFVWRRCDFIKYKNQPRTKSCNVKSYEENDWLLAEVTKRRNVILLEIWILRQRTSKMEPVWESYDVYIIIVGIKYRLKIKVRTSENNLKESCSTHRDLCVDIINLENRARIWDIWNLENNFSSHAHFRMSRTDSCNTRRFELDK